MVLVVLLGRVSKCGDINNCHEDCTGLKRHTKNPEIALGLVVPVKTDLSLDGETGGRASGEVWVGGVDDGESFAKRLPAEFKDLIYWRCHT